MSEQHKVVSKEQWLEARRALLEREKEFTRARDALSRARRELPWERVEKSYVFEGPKGRETLSDLFAGKSQLVIYHFMFGPDWETGCKSCSFWADNLDGVAPHLRQRDTTFLAVSRAPLAKLEAFRRRMDWSFKWVSSAGSDFNFDYNVSFRPEDSAGGKTVYNYAPLESSMSELPGISVFFKDASGAIFHTYSCYARGLDMVNGAYQLLDLTPKGRDEAGLAHTMAWVRLHDLYEDDVGGRPQPA